MLTAASIGIAHCSTRAFAAAASMVRMTRGLRSFVLFAKETACYQSRIRCESHGLRCAFRGEYAQYRKRTVASIRKLYHAHWRA
ncbi:hypothetical protein WS70_23050 [Burkholderia mayonis]|uniref:Uncharacterized protein n=1 Tax=Burkholderia mayonis TaxID=1385591 RepID=A0A1B4FQ30_9BURK|nr:hypothetical protein WS70_23050 [Burkholderia mayonis]KVE42146.1 hypothetical protein WS70_12595 [Burkholderia mayonis]